MGFIRILQLHLPHMIFQFVKIFIETDSMSFHSDTLGGHDTIAALDEAIRDRRNRRIKTELFIREVEKLDGMILVFSNWLWYSLVNYATVHSKDDVRFMFNNGMEL